MQTVLTTAHTWFFESISHVIEGSLVIRLVEGIKGAQREDVEVGDTKLSPYFPVSVQANSRCAVVGFNQALAYFVYDESFDTSDPEMTKDEGRFLYAVGASTFGKFAEQRTNLKNLREGTYIQHLLWCEDRVFHVISPSGPSVDITADAPDLSVTRTSTWSAS